jgi:hypothetical protein
VSISRSGGRRDETSHHHTIVPGFGISKGPDLDNQTRQFRHTWYLPIYHWGKRLGTIFDTDD